MNDEVHVEEPEVSAPEPTEARAEEAPKPSWSQEAEEEARAFGWKSEDEWKGDKPPTYIADPEQYLERLQKMKPFRVMQDRLAEQQEALRKIEAMNQRALDMQRQQYEARIREVEAAQLKAVEAGDVDGYKRLSQQREQLQGAMTNAPDRGDEAQAYVESYKQTEEGRWVNDPALRAMGAQLINDNPQIQMASPQEQIAYARQQLAELYPHKFRAPEPARPAPRTSPVEAGGLASASRGTGFEKLPSEAKAAFKRQWDQGVYSHFKDEAAARKFYVEEYNNA